MEIEIWNWTAYLWDCLEKMDELIAEWVKVDAIITDPPYWTTACKWDTVIPFDKMWERLNKLIKPNWAIVLFGSEPFSSALRMSNITQYKYDWIWNKVQKSNFLNAKKQPLRSYENICVFYKKQPTYNFIKTTWHKKKEVKNIERKTVELYNEQNWIQNYSSIERYPHSVIKFNKDTQKSSLHPTQKPVALMEYLIKTYSHKDEVILDFTAGSFSTWVACQNTNRKFILIEKDETYFNAWVERINNLINNLTKWIY